LSTKSSTGRAPEAVDELARRPVHLLHWLEHSSEKLEASTFKGAKT
jgi:hypothetical protein